MTNPDIESLAALIAAAVILASAAILGWVLSRAMLKAGEASPHSSGLLVALGLLTMTALVIAGVTGSESAWAVAASGVGAVGGALTSVYHGTDSEHDPEEGENDL